ncbi:Mitofusin-1 [Exaiptasia diaphana]|nr:Mitofusin-1 [Exaiptasia diaphana]
MPVAALVIKLIKKEILCDSVIMITSRSGKADELDGELHFDRCVEITGFSEEQVLQYVEKYFNSKPEEVKKMAMEKVKGTAHYMSFGRVPLRCLFVCQVIEWQIKNKITRNNLVPLTLTQFYRDIISCLERANREMDSLDKEEASLAVEKTLDNFSELAAQLAEQNRFAFTQKDLEKLKLPENEISYLKSSNLIFCYPVASDSPFPQTTLEYSFSHLTIQEFFVACHLVKKRAMAAQGTSNMVHIFTSGLLGLDQENNNDKFMSKVLESVCKQGMHRWIQRVVLLRCLHEYGQEKEFTRQELTTNRDYRYWDSLGWIALHGVTDTDCDALAMLLESTATSISSPPDRLDIVRSQITITMLNRLLSSLHSNSTITALGLAMCSLYDDHVKCLCNHFNNTHITSLNLSFNNITDVGVHHIVHSNTASKLTYLNLAGNNITDVGVDYIVHSNIASKLTYLNLLGNPVSVEECISKSAIQTKFESHAVSGMSIISRVKVILETIAGWGHEHRHPLSDPVQAPCPLEIPLMIVSSPLLTSPNTELNKHIENGLGRNLMSRCSNSQTQIIHESQNEMTEEMKKLLPQSAQENVMVASPRNDFEVSYRLEIHDLCSDFEEDIEFHFSLGWEALMKKFLAPRNAKLAVAMGKSIERDVKNMMPNQDPAHPGQVSTRRNSDVVPRYNDDELTLAVVQGVASLTSRTTTLVVVVGGLVSNKTTLNLWASFAMRYRGSPTQLN